MTSEQLALLRKSYDIGPGLTQAQTALQITRAEQFLELARRLIGPIPPP